MTNPVTFKPTYSKSVLNQYNVAVQYWKRVNMSAQRAPFNILTPYQRHYGGVWQSQWTGRYLGNGLPYTAESAPTAKFDSTRYNDLLAKSYERLRGEVYNSVQAGLNFVEADQAVHAIVRSAATLLGVYRDVKKLRFGDAAKKLRMHFVPKGVNVRHSAASNFLEYHFGWAPLVSDIYDALETYREPLKNLEASRGRAHDKYLVHDVVYTASDGGWWKSDITYQCSMSVAQGCTVRAIRDQNALSLEQYGLSNPAAIVWEAVPFSFVVDWFANVGDVLQSYSSFAGLELVNTFTSVNYQVDWSGRNSWTIQPTFNLPAAAVLTYGGTGRWYDRATSLTAPTFKLKHFQQPSATRAVTALALLVQQLRSPWKVVYINPRYF